jgi:hypothetical protein
MTYASRVNELTETKSRVAEMSAEADRGSSPIELTQFLQKTFPRRGPRWLTRILGPLPDKAYAVRGIVPFGDGGFFLRSCVFQVTAPAGLLEGHFLPTGGSFGLFALSPIGLSYLTRRREAVEALFRQEGRPIDEGNSFALACFFAETLDRNGNASGDILRSAEDLASYTGGRDGFGGDYVLDPVEWNRVRTSVDAPVIVGDAQSGWRLEYCSVFGWMHAKDALSKHRVGIDPDFRIEAKETVLSSKIFSRMPGVRY